MCHEKENEKYFDFQNKDIKGVLIISLNSNEYIKLTIKENNDVYENIFSLENLKLKNKNFELSDLKEIYNIIIKFIENKKCNIEKYSYYYILTIQFEFNDITQSEFILINVNKNKDDLLQEVIIDQKIIKSQIEIMQANQNEIKGILYFLIKKLDKLSQQIKIEDDFEEILKSSKIVDSEQIKIIKNWISPEKKNNL